MIASRDFTCRPREPSAPQVLQVLHEESGFGALGVQGFRGLGFMVEESREGSARLLEEVP